MNLILLLLLTLTLGSYTVQAQSTYSILEDANGDLTVAEYDASPNTFSNSFNLNSTNFATGFDPSAAFYDPLSQEVKIASDTNMYFIAGSSITTQPLPFAHIGGYDWKLFYDHSLHVVYSLLEDANGDLTVAQYNRLTNTLTSSVNINTTALATGYDPSAAYYDPALQSIVVASNGNIHTTNAYNGATTSQTLPFIHAGGYSWNLYYDNQSNEVYSLLEDANGDLTVAQYHSSTNTFSNSFNLNATALATGFDVVTSYYASYSKEMIVASNGNVHTINVTTGVVSSQPLPFIHAGGYSWTLLHSAWRGMSVDKRSFPITKIDLYPNPCTTHLVIELKAPFSPNTTISLVNTLGEVVLTTTITNNQTTIDVSKLVKGVYFIQFPEGTLQESIIIQ